MNNQSLFEQALLRIENGEPFTEVAQEYPQEVRDMLFVVHKMTMFSSQKQPSAIKQTAHKKIFLTQAAREQGRPIFLPFSLVARLAVLFFVVILSLTFTGLVSVQALPGDVLYGVKRTVEQVQLNLTANSSGKLQLEEVFDARRVAEVQKLRAEQRWGAVQFAGWLEIQPKGTWMVEDLTIIPDQSASQALKALNGSYVEVNGTLQADGVEAEVIQLRLFNLSGMLSKTDGEWLLDGTPLEISPETRIRGKLITGSQAEVTAIHVVDNRYVALVVVVGENEDK